ncbi:hypothetical protein SOVF_128650 [Spinacia oleracea]|uniref:Precursor of CEP9 n=1 Tax=Spinacia oleracea TaxID=3562 RepID=A0ABM3RJA3_SPIOL|nr:precursor of CEP9 [Spinacia oleracea]KNA12130.1 hypothetical protein SOVF_128650 [Spinacia oleracea]
MSRRGKSINYVKSPSYRGIRKLSSQIHKSDHSEKSPKKNTQQKTSAEFPQTEIHKKNFPSLKPTPSSQRSSHKVDSLWVNKVDSSVQKNCLGEKCPDDFRSTAPGHSPGAGHSFMTNTDKTSTNQQTKSPRMWNSLTASEDDFRHTTPGHSPGAGHAEEDRDPNLTTSEVETTFPPPPSITSFFSESALVSTNDFRPTTPGDSPGAGHFHKNKIDVQRTGYCHSENCTDDFRPTKPGDSPGAGHSYTDRITSQQHKHPGVAHPHAGGKDDYRPTKPGHSPGAGHAFLNMQEPNP